MGEHALDRRKETGTTPQASLAPLAWRKERSEATANEVARLEKARGELTQTHDLLDRE